ncbi:hypothetical protein BB561_002906 [Smittium simulii]|uniref:Protein ARV n=1 Tax=Smittium simulii TaxID=133385 RepID=A0A2T9YNU6_9FUNG|nr:hypothetical protein BB561_002906 [Smittium simulii]
MDELISFLGPFVSPLNFLVCTISLTDFKGLKFWKPLECTTLGCECCVIGDPNFSFLFPLIIIWTLTAVTLTFAPRTNTSPLETILLNIQKKVKPNHSISSQSSEEQKSKKYVCIECGNPVYSLYTQYSKENIRLTQCDKCHNFVDRYVEHDLIIIFIDIILYNPQVYRHLLINKENFRTRVLEKNVIKIMTLLIMFNVYISWYRLEEAGKIRNQENMFFGYQMHFFYQYLCILFLSIIEFCVYIGGIVAALIIVQRSVKLADKWANIATAIVVSSFGRTMMVFLVIWKYQSYFYSILLDILMYSSHSTALSDSWIFSLLYFNMFMGPPQLSQEQKDQMSNDTRNKVVKFLAIVATFRLATVALEAIKMI